MLHFLRYALRSLQLPAGGKTAAEVKDAAVRAKRERASQEAAKRAISKENPAPVNDSTPKRQKRDGETANLGSIKRAKDNNNE